MGSSRSRATSIRGMIRSFSIEVHDVTYHRYYEVYEDKATPTERIRGTAIIEKGDSVEVAGLAGSRMKSVPFTLRPVEKEKYHWTASIGYLPYDWEIGHDAQFYIECYVPKDAFDDLERAYSSGRVTMLTLLLDTTLWVHEFDWHTPPSGDVVWYMVPEVEKQSESPQHETGKITQLGWQEVPLLRSRPPRPPGETPKEDHPAYKLGQQLAQDTIRAAMDEPKAPADPAQEGIVLGLKLAWAVGIFLAIVFVIASSTDQRRRPTG